MRPEETARKTKWIVLRQVLAAIKRDFTCQKHIKVV